MTARTDPREPSPEALAPPHSSLPETAATSDHASGAAVAAGLVSSPILAGERVTFTGTLASMTHRQAQELVELHGGTATQHVSRQTTLLVVGEEGWPLEPDGSPAIKFLQAMRLREEGQPLRLLRESEWLASLGIAERMADVRRLYTPAMLSQMLNLPVTRIRSWERLGLIRPVKQVYRLSYFDFQEVAGVRRLADLLAAGISARRVEASLRRLELVLGPSARPLAQLELLERERRVVFRDPEGRLLDPASGQRLFDFPSDGDARPAGNSPGTPPSAQALDELAVTLPFSAPAFSARTFEEWSAQAGRLVEEGRLDDAVAAFHHALRHRPNAADVHFQLAEVLYRLDQTAAARERYLVAIEHDPDHLEAWTQLGCVYAQLGQFDSALAAFDRALQLHPECPEAHLHKADLLHELGRETEARTHWRMYLRFDQRGPWAETARQRLNAADEIPT